MRPPNVPGAKSGVPGTNAPVTWLSPVSRTLKVPEHGIFLFFFWSIPLQLTHPR